MHSLYTHKKPIITVWDCSRIISHGMAWMNPTATERIGETCGDGLSGARSGNSEPPEQREMANVEGGGSWVQLSLSFHFSKFSIEGFPVNSQYMRRLIFIAPHFI